MDVETKTINKSNTNHSPQDIFSIECNLANFITATSMYLFSLFEPEELLKALKIFASTKQNKDDFLEYRIKRFIDMLNIENFQIYFMKKFYQRKIRDFLLNRINNPNVINKMLITLNNFLDTYKDLINPVFNKLISIKSKLDITSLTQKYESHDLVAIQLTKKSKDKSSSSSSSQDPNEEFSQKQKLLDTALAPLTELRKKIDTSSILEATTMLLYILYSADKDAEKASQGITL